MSTSCIIYRDFIALARCADRSIGGLAILPIEPDDLGAQEMPGTEIGGDSSRIHDATSLTQTVTSQAIYDHSKSPTYTDWK